MSKETKYYFCDCCGMPCDTEECPNCFIRARELNPQEECIECGHCLGECTCIEEVKREGDNDNM